MVDLLSAESFSCFVLSESNVIKKQAQNNFKNPFLANPPQYCRKIEHHVVVRIQIAAIKITPPLPPSLKTYQGCRWMVSHGNKYSEVCCCGISAVISNLVWIFQS